VDDFTGAVALADLARREELGGVIRVVAAGGGALRRFLDRGGDRLAHLERHQGA